MKSGIVAAETIFAAMQDKERMAKYFEDAVEKEEYEDEDQEEEEEVDEDEEWDEEEEEEDEAMGEFPTLLSGIDLPEFEDKIKESWIYEDLYKVRNAKPSIGVEGSVEIFVNFWPTDGYKNFPKT